MSDLRSDMQNRETYLGDGVYASFTGGMIKLRTQRHTDRHDTDDVVFLEPEVLGALVKFARQFQTIER